MKKIIIIDGGPRKNMNTAKLLQSFAEGAKSAGGDIEVKTVRLYDIDYRGCMSCMACKLKGKASNICRFKDALAPVLEEIAQAERLAFPWLSYNDYSLTAPKRMPVVLVETMNGTPERNNSNHFGTMEWCITSALGEPERIIGYNTCQVAKYGNYELGSFSEEAKHAWRDAHWEEDLQKAFETGKRMAEQKTLSH